LRSTCAAQSAEGQVVRAFRSDAVVQIMEEEMVANRPVLGKMKKLCRRFKWKGASARSLIFGILLLSACLPSLQAGNKDKISYGEGLMVNVPFPEAEVEQVVQDITQNGIIRGTKEYNKDEYVGGATAAASTRAFPPWTEGGKVFYKVRLQAIDPRNFKDSGDVGTLAVRYVLQPQGDKNTVLRINAVFVEDFRHTVHASDGSVESSECKDIHDHLDAIEVMKTQTLEAEKERDQQRLQKQGQAMTGGSSSSRTSPASGDVTANNSVPSEGSVASRPTVAPNVAQNPAQSPVPSPEQSAVPVTRPEPQPIPDQAAGQTLELHVQDLRHRVERLVKAPGAPLKSAPFHTASTLSALPTGTEVLILISTQYWYGVETREGQHGWISRDEVEPLP